MILALALALDPRLARRVGVLTLAVLALTSAGFVFLSGRLALGTPLRFRVVFRHVAGLTERAPLVVGGTQVGRVAAISPLPHGAPGSLADGAGVVVTIEIRPEDAAKVPGDAAIFVALRGALSDRYLEVAPPAGAPGPPIHDGAELRGVDPPTLDNVLQHTWANLTTFRQFLDTVRPELTALGAALDQLGSEWRALAGDPRTIGVVVALAAATGELITAAQNTWNGALGGGPGVAHARATVDQARRTIAQLRVALDALGPALATTMAHTARIRDQLAAQAPLSRAEHIITALRLAIDQADAVLAMATELASRFADGEGSIGRLMADPEFPEDTKDLGKYLKRHPWKFLERPVDP